MQWSLQMQRVGRVEVGERRCRRSIGARAVPIAPSPRPHAPAMTRLSLLALAALAALAAHAPVRADPPQPRLIDFNPFSWLPINRNRSPFIMDYFFPPSRTPKQSTFDPPADRKPPPETTLPETTLDNTPAPTTLEDRLTTYSRKVSTKTKSTLPATATSPPKTKKPSRKPVPTETTLETKVPSTKIETAPPTFKVTTVPTTYRPTKHYTIRPVVRTETPTIQDTETTNSDSTETVSELDTAGTTAEDAKETAPTLSTPEDVRSTDPGISTTTVESTTPTDATAEPADSREGYLPLRDKPQQTHVKINDQTKKEVSDLIQKSYAFFFLNGYSLIAATFLVPVTVFSQVAS